MKPSKVFHRRGLVLLIVGVIILAVAVSSILIFKGTEPSKIPTESGAIVKVTTGDILVTVSATGKLEPKLIMNIRPDPNLPTRAITQILVKNGDKVKSGQVLARVESSGLDLDRDSAMAAWNSQKARLAALQSGAVPDAVIQAESSLNQAKISLQQANADLMRNKLLFDQGAITEQSWNNYQTTVSLAQSKLQAAQSAYDIVKAGTAKADIQSQQSAVSQAESTFRKAQLILDATYIRTPIEGTITEVLQNIGDLATGATAMFSVSQMDQMLVRGYVDEVDQPAVNVGQTVAVSFDGLPDTKFSGLVTEVDKRALVVSNVTMFTVLIQIPNPNGKLLWGMSATADITTSDLRGVLVIPKAALRTAPGRAQVVVVDGSDQYLWDVKTGPSQGNLIQVVAGLAEGDSILAVAPRQTTNSNIRGGNRGGQTGPGGGNLLGGGPGGGNMLRGLR